VSVDQIKHRITRAFAQYLRAPLTEARRALSSVNGGGKIYEAYVLSLLARDLTRLENCELTLVAGTRFNLRTSHGATNPAYSRIIVKRQNNVIGEIWTDIEFTSLSYYRDPQNSIRLGTRPPPGSRHELDILMTSQNPYNYPTPDQILIGVECKNTVYQKRMLREILGVRRELSYFSKPMPAAFIAWPRATVPAHPPSCLLVYSSDPSICTFTNPPNDTFGIDFFHEPI